MIPRLIMQTWRTRDVPERWKQAQRSVWEAMPDWKYVLLTDADIEAFVRQEYPELWPLFESYEYGIQRADAVRPLWLKKNGGVYLDLDYVVHKPFDEKLFAVDGSDTYLIKSGNFGGRHYTNSFMASEPGAPLWDAYIEELKANRGRGMTKHWRVLRSTGPLALDRAVKRTKAVARIHTIPAALVMPCSICEIYANQCRRRKEAYASPIAGASWIGWDTRLLNMLYCNRRVVVGVGVAVILALAATVALAFVVYSAAPRLTRSWRKAVG